MIPEGGVVGATGAEKCTQRCLHVPRDALLALRLWAVPAGFGGLLAESHGTSQPRIGRSEENGVSSLGRDSRTKA